MSSTETILRLLTQLSEDDPAPILWGRTACRHFGPMFERLLRQRVLVERARAETWPVCTHCECGLEARPILSAGGALRAACPYDHHADERLEDDDLRSFRIDTDALVALLAVQSGLGGAACIMPGVWHLGALASGRVILLVLSRAPICQPGLIFGLKVAAAGAPTTLIGPEIAHPERLRFLEAGIDYIVLNAALNGAAGADALDINLLEPRRRAVRLFIARRARRIELDCRPLRLSPQQFKLLLFLAEHACAGPDPVPTRTIENHLWGASIHRITTTLRDPVRAVRNALACGAADPAATRAIIENTRDPNGYRLRLDAGEIRICDQG